MYVRSSLLTLVPALVFYARRTRRGLFVALSERLFYLHLTIPKVILGHVPPLSARGQPIPGTCAGGYLVKELHFYPFDNDQGASYVVRLNLPGG